MNFFSTLRFRILLAYALVLLSALAVSLFLLDRSGTLPLEELRGRAALALALVSLAGLAAGWLIALFVSRQFGEIIAGSKRFAAGEFDYRIPVGSSGELRKLSETLNYMAGEIGAKVREAGLRRMELEAAFRDMPEAVMVTDGYGSVTRMNPRARQLMGVKGFEPEGMRLSELPSGPGFSDAALKALSSGKPVSFETQPPSSPGTTLAVGAYPVLEGGTVRGCVLVARDITGPLRLETLRKEFVANVSHELKTPLTAIRGCAETLLSGAMEDREHGPGFARSILDQAVRLETLVGDLLKISDAESGGEKADKAVFPLRALAGETASGLRDLFAAREVSVSNEIPEGLEVSADRAKLSQVFINLLDNAAKYSRKGGRITVRASASSAGVRVSVDDDGPGIPAGHLPHLFERFYRVDKARSRELGGTGLGLSIVKHLIEMHGGEVGVESSEGRGSSFWFTLPV